MGSTSNCFREADGLTTSVGKAAILQNLQKLVENSYMGLLDFVEQEDAKRTL